MIAKGKYGIEHFDKPSERESGGLGCLVVCLVILVAISLVYTLVSRVWQKQEEGGKESPVVEEQIPSPAPSASKAVPPPRVNVAPTPPNKGVLGKSFEKRPPMLQNLIMRLQEAESKGNVEMAITTIEQIRALPGSPAADLDDHLARRLGVLNFKRLFVLRNAQWVKTVTVRRGDYATRIAAENGSTFASLVKLNDKSVSQLRIGEKVNVMNHPRFRLVLHRRSKLADLSLNGKFFKRYDITSAVSAPADTYEVTIPIRKFWSTIGVEFSASDRAELEMLLPKGAPVVVSEL